MRQHRKLGLSGKIETLWSQSQTFDYCSILSQTTLLSKEIWPHPTKGSGATSRNKNKEAVIVAMSWRPEAGISRLFQQLAGPSWKIVSLGCHTDLGPLMGWTMYALQPRKIQIYLSTGNASLQDTGRHPFHQEEEASWTQQGTYSRSLPPPLSILWSAMI